LSAALHIAGHRFWAFKASGIWAKFPMLFGRNPDERRRTNFYHIRAHRPSRGVSSKLEHDTCVAVGVRSTELVAAASNLVRPGRKS